MRVNAISPGVVQADPEHRGRRDDARNARRRRSARPTAIAHAAVYLASDESAFVHGTVIDVDGGRTAVAVIAA